EHEGKQGADPADEPRGWYSVGFFRRLRRGGCGVVFRRLGVGFWVRFTGDFDAVEQVVTSVCPGHDPTPLSTAETPSASAGGMLVTNPVSPNAATALTIPTPRTSSPRMAFRRMRYQPRASTPMMLMMTTAFISVSPLDT